MSQTVFILLEGEEFDKGFGGVFASVDRAKAVADERISRSWSFRGWREYVDEDRTWYRDDYRIFECNVVDERKEASNDNIPE